LSAPDSEANKSVHILPGPATRTCMQSFKNTAHVSVLEAVACQVQIMWLCNLPTFFTSVLCKESNTPALRSRNCSRNVAAKHAFVLLCEGCILSYVQNSCLLAFLQRASCLALLQYVSCIITCNTTPCGLRTALWKACKSCPSRVVCSHHVCCLPDTMPVCVSSSLQVLSRQTAGRCTSCAK